MKEYSVCKKITGEHWPISVPSTRLAALAIMSGPCNYYCLLLAQLCFQWHIIRGTKKCQDTVYIHGQINRFWVAMYFNSLFCTIILTCFQCLELDWLTGTSVAKAVSRMDFTDIHCKLLQSQWKGVSGLSGRNFYHKIWNVEGILSCHDAIGWYWSQTVREGDCRRTPGQSGCTSWNSWKLEIGRR